MDRRRTTRLPPWAALALGVALFAGAAPSAAASCGEYVHILPPDQATNADPAPQPPAPCGGPGCRQAPSAPMPAPPPAPTTAQPHEAILAAAPPPAPPGGAWSRSDSSPSPRRTATAIFHPPRV